MGPSLKFNSPPGTLSGGASVAVKFSVDLSILYDYGEVGYKDVRFTAATGSAWTKIITQMSFSGTDSSADRKLGFTINLFLLMRCNSNGQVFGGHVHHSLDR